MSAASPRKGEVPAADAAKADYLYLESLREKSQDNLDAAYSLLERAASLNPTDKEIGLELSNYLFMMSTDPVNDTLQLSRGLTLLRDYCLDNPTDYHTWVRYGLLGQRLLPRDQALEIWESMHGTFPARSEISFQLADMLARGGTPEQRDRALAIFDSIETAEGPSPQLSSNKINLYLAQSDTSSIIAEADRLYESRPGNVEFAVFAGKVHSLFGDSDKALALFTRACELDPTSGLAFYSRAEYYQSKGDSVGYDREINNALRLQSLDVDTKLTILKNYISHSYTDSVQQPRIRELFDTLLVQHPAEPELHDTYASYLIQIAKDYPAAAEQLEQVVGLEPDNEDAWGVLPQLYLQNDDLKNAASVARRSLHYYPDNARTYIILGAIYAQEHQGDSCRAALDRALTLTDPSDTKSLSSIYTSLGDNFYQQEMADSAFVYYRKALQYDPENTLALNNCAYHLAVSGVDLDDALAMIEKVMSIENDNPTSLDTYAWVLFRRKEYAKAREIIDRTLQLIPEDEMSADVLEHAGDIYFMDAEPEKAVEFWKSALKLAPDNDILRRKVKNRAYYYE